jgi:branched-chain amino acid transport system permease protein
MTADIILQVVLSGLLSGAVYALIAIGFTLIFGVLDIVNFAHGTVAALAMYAAYVIYQTMGLDPFVALIPVVLLALAFGAGLHKLLISRIIGTHHFTQIICTLGVFIFFENLMNMIFGGDLRGISVSYTTQSWDVGSFSIPVARGAAALVSALTVIGLTIFLNHTNLGKAIRAASNNRVGAHLVGINVRQIYLWAFMISTALAAIAGVVIMPFALVSPFVSGDFLLKSFVIAIVGGLGSVPGALIAGLLIGVAEALSELFLTDSFGNVIVFGILLLTLIIRPAGLVPVQR